MTPTLEINVRIRGWGRIKKATGSHEVRVQRSMAEMVRLLGKQRRFDVLEAIRDGDVSLAEVYALHERGELAQLPTGAALHALIPTIETWLDAHEASDHHRANQWSAWRKLKRHALAAHRLDELPALLKRLRVECVKAGHAAMFNRTREMLSAFLRDTLNRRHVLYVDVRDVAPLTETPEKANPQTVAQVNELAARLGDEAGAMWRTLCLTGMRPREYFELPWELGVDRIVVRNAKVGGTRVVPLLEPPANPTSPRRNGASQKRWLMDLVSEESKGAVTLYNARDTFAHWCDEARIPKTRIDLYLGHGPRSMTDLYAWHDVSGYLAEDAGKLRELLQAGTKGGTMEKQA